MTAPGAASVAIAVFARTPVPGTAKTRLIPRLGPEGAAQLQAQLTERAVARANEVAPQAVSLWWTGEGADTPHPTARVFQQHGADLGARMSHAFDTLLPQHEQVLLIGTDCPAQSADDLHAAARALHGPHGADIVLQPAEDGGYVLVGIARHAPPPWRAIFEGVAWGTGAVLEQTLDRAAQSGLTFRLLPPRPDLDTPDDYDRAIAAGWIAAGGMGPGANAAR